MTDLPPPPHQPWGTPGASGAPPPWPGGRPPGMNGLAVASLITALVGIPLMLFCFIGWIAWIVAIPLGIVALSQIKRSGGLQGGRGLAIGGVVTSAVCLALTIIAGLLFLVFVVLLAGSVSDLCDEDRDGDGVNVCLDADDSDPDVGREPFEGFDTTTTVSVPR